MPISKYFKGHGTEVLANMEKEYGTGKGKSVFYATANKTGQKPSEDAILPVDASTKAAIAAHNSGLTQSQDRRVRDAAAGWASSYVAAIRNVDKKSYAQKYAELLEKENGDPSTKLDYPGLSYMAAQAVRMNLMSLYDKSHAKDEDPDLIQPVPVRPVPTPAGEHNERGWFRGAAKDALSPAEVRELAELRAERKRGPLSPEKTRRYFELKQKSQTPARDVSALASKEDQFKPGTRVHNSKGSVGEVVHVNGDKVIVAVAGKRQEWPLVKTFRAGGAEDGESAPHKFEVMPGNKPGRPCNRCLEKRDHPNHDPRAIVEYQKSKGKAGGKDDGLAPVADLIPPGAGSRKASEPYKPFGFTKEQLKQTLAPKDPAGFARQFGKDAAALKWEKDGKDWFLLVDGRYSWAVNAHGSGWSVEDELGNRKKAFASLAEAKAYAEANAKPRSGETRGSRTAPVRVRDASGRWGAVKAAKEPGLEPVEDLNPDASERAVFASYADKAAKAKRKKAAKKAARTRKRNRARDASARAADYDLVPEDCVANIRYYEAQVKAAEKLRAKRGDEETDADLRFYKEQLAMEKRNLERVKRGEKVTARDDHEEEGFERLGSRPLKPAPHEDLRPVAV